MMDNNVFNTTDPLAGKRILLGVSGSIAAYKSPDLVRALRAAGAEVRVALSAAAAEFVAPLTLQAVSGQPVRTALFAAAEETAMDHIRLARWADACLLAPITAHGLARLAQGLADDLISTIVLATRAPVFLAPAMNVQMWEHPATRRNCAALRTDGVHFLGPESGSLACGEEGEGRMLAPERIVAELRLALAEKTLPGMRILITAGPTWEALDPARGISNRASGKQGFAIAQAFAEAGAVVTLVAGPGHEPTPPGITRQDVVSAEEMQAACLQAMENGVEVFIANAAVADHRPAQRSSQKMDKGSLPNPLPLTENPDIVAAMARHPRRPRWVIAFAAQTHDHLEQAAAKARAKGVDMIIVNAIGDGRTGMGASTNHLRMLYAGQMTDLGSGDKLTLARRLVHTLTPLLQHTPPSSRETSESP
ncbi:bifunctional phosphopantothenoylcysteine decarboxylase/phosphopantothenate--cysteine ligase CoaBC [Acidithiobacillus sp.]